MKKNDKKMIWVGLVVSLLFFVIFIFTKNIGQNITNPNASIPLSSSLPSSSKEIKNINKAFLEVQGKKINTEIKNGETIYKFMEKLQKEEKISFRDKTYPGMGKLIEEINGIKNGDKYWIYYVNNKKANVGVSNYKIKTGDVVSWKYQSF